MTHDGYETAYYVDGERRSLIEDMRAAANWCEKELSAIAAPPPVPAINLPGDMLDSGSRLSRHIDLTRPTVWRTSKPSNCG